MLYRLERARKLLEGLLLYRADSQQTIAHQLQLHAERTPDGAFLLYRARRYSYAEANALINRHAHAYRALGIGTGDVVALAMENRPEFLWHFFALHKLGAVAALINTNLQADALAHAVRISSPKRVVIGSEVWAAFEPILDMLGPDARANLEVDRDPDSAAAPPTASVWSARLEGVTAENPRVEPPPMLRDHAAYIYTSGTTGLPKAAIVRHERFFRGGAVWSALAFRFRPGDVLYNCLPLYHANAILLATSSAVSAGVTLALARKFSRSHFWDDVRSFNASSFIYIGELCRYLMNSPPSPSDRQHRVRSISGNGLRPELWRPLQKRFGIKRVTEFYAATEGNAVTLNMLGLPGSVGPRTRGMRLVRWDERTNDFVRDAAGWLTRAEVGEPGVLLGKIRPRAEFEGYQDRRASEQKIVRNAFAAGDAYFNTGDLLRLDRLHHLYFVDRLGDTYRWKGENVATTEVQAQLSSWPPIEEANVYGVSIPGTEGKAGMAAIALRAGAEFEPVAFRDHVATGLPGYARPVFVRVMKELAKTSTFKLMKNELQREGFDPSRSADRLYYRDPGGDYLELTPAAYDAIVSGKTRL